MDFSNSPSDPERARNRDMIEVQILPLVSNVELPAPATACTRSTIPPGYGVQEHCLPFTSATALGFLVRSPIAFGLCLPGDLPADVHTFRSPVERRAPNGVFKDSRVFYVRDEPRCRFMKNAFKLDT